MLHHASSIEKQPAQARDVFMKLLMVYYWIPLSLTIGDEVNFVLSTIDVHVHSLCRWWHFIR